jgi:hypothetical protein
MNPAASLCFTAASNRHRGCAYDERSCQSSKPVFDDPHRVAPLRISTGTDAHGSSLFAPFFFLFALHSGSPADNAFEAEFTRVAEHPSRRRRPYVLAEPNSRSSFRILKTSDSGGRFRRYSSRSHEPCSADERAGDMAKPKPPPYPKPPRPPAEPPRPVTRCGRCASYAVPTYSFPSAAGQSVPSVPPAHPAPRGGPTADRLAGIPFGSVLPASG